VSSSPPTDDPVDPARDAAAGLGELLDAVEAGRLEGWHALPEGASVATLTALRPGAAPARDLTTLLGQPAAGYRLAATPHAPAGVVVWTQHGEVTLIDVPGPRLADGQLEALGPPEATLASGLGRSLEQRLWPRRGLILHVARATGRVDRLYGHQAATLAQMRTSPLAAVRIERHPRPI
jgi:hypothetical protein